MDSERRRAYLREYRKKNRDRLREIDRKCYRRNRPKRLLKRKRQSLRKYGLTIEDYDRMLAEQDGRCAICGSDKPGGRGGMHVDHDHRSGKVRKLLCTTCNALLGMADDNERVLLAAVDYLKSFSVRSEP